MSSFIRGKQAGVQKDLSGSLTPEIFTPDDQARYGINSQIRWVARPFLFLRLRCPWETLQK